MVSVIPEPEISRALKPHRLTKTGELTVEFNKSAIANVRKRRRA
jgi:hypothetical protein